MIFRKQLDLEILLFLCIGILAGFFVLQLQNRQMRLPNPVVVTTEKEMPTATPTPTFIPKTATVSQISSDGTRKVILKTTENKDMTRTYDISTVEDGPVIFTQTLYPEETITLPFNTWSADNKYFFIQENSKAGKKILIFRENGDNFADGEAYLNLTDEFEHRTSGVNRFDEATGWAEGHLIIINTKLEDGTQGSSFWFEVPDKALIQLSTKF